MVQPVLDDLRDGDCQSDVVHSYSKLEQSHLVPYDVDAVIVRCIASLSMLYVGPWQRYFAG